jgi:predicted small lipoprotein YifL
MMSMSLPAQPRMAALILALSLAGLSGCGRRGALDYPPEVAARPKAVVVQKTTVRPAGSKTPVAEEVKAEEYIPGTIGHRPPDQYPFPLDPLL